MLKHLATSWTWWIRRIINILELCKKKRWMSVSTSFTTAFCHWKYDNRVFSVRKKKHSFRLSLLFPWTTSTTSDRRRLSRKDRAEGIYRPRIMTCHLWTMFQGEGVVSCTTLQFTLHQTTAMQSWCVVNPKGAQSMVIVIINFYDWRCRQVDLIYDTPACASNMQRSTSSASWSIS